MFKDVCWLSSEVIYFNYPDSFPCGPLPLNGSRQYSSCLCGLLYHWVSFFYPIFGFFFKYSSQGIYLRSVPIINLPPLSLGVHVRRVFAMSWAICALVCGISGIILGIMTGSMSMISGVMGLKVFPVVILGGLGKYWGAIIGGLIIGILETFTGGYVSTSLKEVIPYIVLVFILLVKPYGLFGPGRD